MTATIYHCPACTSVHSSYEDYDRHRRTVHGHTADGRLVVSEPTIRDLAKELDELRREIAAIRALLVKQR